MDSGRKSAGAGRGRRRRRRRRRRAHVGRSRSRSRSRTCFWRMKSASCRRASGQRSGPRPGTTTPIGSGRASTGTAGSPRAKSSVPSPKAPDRHPASDGLFQVLMETFTGVCDEFQWKARDAEEAR
eukprot:1601568-Rhodomonas_salina.1